MNSKFKSTVKLFQKLPGVGPRQAARFVLALLEKNESELRELGQAITFLKKNIKFCKECFNISESNPCHICSDPGRDKTKLLVLEKVTDLDSMEKTGLYKGLYHVLGGAINPLDGITPETLSFKELESRIKNLGKEKEPLELIVATNPTTTGETTALYIMDLLKNQKGVSLTRLGKGLASGTTLEYADEITLRNALKYRI